MGAELASGTYWAVAVVGLLALMVPVLVLALAHALGPRTERRRENEDKLEVYECGILPEVDARRRFSAKFYLVAVLFVIFDIEVAFLIPWGVTFRELGAPGELGWGAFVQMLVFLGLLMVGLGYLVRRGALEWE
jgi:NADH-quinone oxidoreductase subunit A